MIAVWGTIEVVSEAPFEIRRELRAGDLEAIVAFHGRVYPPEYAVDASFVRDVATTAAEAARHGFPREREAVWIVEREGEMAGCLGLTEDAEDPAAGVVRWFVLARSLRGQGLGRLLVDELVVLAREHGYARLGLETFSELRAAAHLYRSHGFDLVWERTAPKWGRDDLTYQRYEVELSPEAAGGAGDAPSAARPARVRPARRAGPSPARAGHPARLR